MGRGKGKRKEMNGKGEKETKENLKKYSHTDSCTFIL